MKQITREVVNAFIQGYNLDKANMKVSNGKMYLHDNLIAINNGDSISITNAGWKSNTTKERLNGLPNVSICQKKGVWYLNDKEWNGEWTDVRSN